MKLDRTHSHLPRTALPALIGSFGRAALLLLAGLAGCNDVRRAPSGPADDVPAPVEARPGWVCEVTCGGYTTRGGLDLERPEERISCVVTTQVPAPSFSSFIGPYPGLSSEAAICELFEEPLPAGPAAVKYFSKDRMGNGVTGSTDGVAGRGCSMKPETACVCGECRSYTVLPPW